MALITCPDCGKRISDAAPACIFCGRPYQPLASCPAVSEAGYPQFVTSPRSQSPTFYCPIAIQKLVLMQVFTFGLYQIHWFYRQWDYIRRSDGRQFNPALRGVLAGIFAYPLFRSIKLRAPAERASVGWSPAALTLLWFGISIVPAVLRLPILALANVLPLVLVQRTINQLNDPSIVERNYSALNISGMVVGGLLWFLIALGEYILLTKGPLPRH
jgi:hypothetical protein